MPAAANPAERRRRARPGALRLRYLAALAGVLVVLLGALALNELRAARRVIAEAMEGGAALLVEAVARAGENAIRADARLEQATAQRLLGQAWTLRELDDAGLLTADRLERLAATTGLHRIHVFDAAGRRQLSSGPEPDGDGRDLPEGPAPGLEPLLAGAEQSVVLGYRQGRFQPGGRYAAAVRRAGGGAILVAVDAQDMLAFRREAGIGRLVQDIGARQDIAYLVLQDRAGVILASRGVRAMGRIEGDAFLETALTGEGPRSRIVDEEDAAPLFETVLPFWVDAETRGLLRLGLVAEAITVAEARSRRRLAVGAGLLAVLGVALVAVIAVRQNYALLDEAYERMQTTSGRLLEDMADAVIAVDAGGRITVCNRAAGALFGLRPERVLGAAPAVLGDAGEHLQAALDAGRELHGQDLQARTPAGRAVDLSVSLARLHNREGAFESAVVVIQDLTERRALELDLRRRERLSAMGELASGVAHEVRNPLNAIAVIAQRLQREFTPAEGAAEYADLTDTVRGEVGRVNDIVRRFLELARRPALRRAPTDLDTLLAGTARLVAHDAEARGLRLETDLEPVGTHLVDGEQLQQALLNLLVNALDAARRGVRLEARRTPEAVVLAVSDDGQGVPAADRERIFDLYYTTKAAGTGLGLGLVQRIVDEHGGRVEVDEAPGGGARFRLLLPLTPEDLPA